MYCIEVETQIQSASGFLKCPCLCQIKTFWAQLSWPDVESSYAYISKILDVSIFLVSYPYILYYILGYF
jgi:hypothetical protein